MEATPSREVLKKAPEGCTCAWTTSFHEGHVTASIFIVGDPCPAFPHPRHIDSRGDEG